MPVRTGVPRTTHQWLKPLYDALDASVSLVVPSGASGIANAVWVGSTVPLTQLGNASGMVSLYGASGIAVRLPTGTAGITGWTGAGSSTVSQIWFNGGSGTYFTISNLVTALKNAGILPL